MAATEQQVRELAETIGAQADAIATGRIVGPRFAAVLRLRENVDTLASWVDDDRQIARGLANAIEREQAGRGHVPRFGIRLANGYVNDNHGKGWPTSKAAEEQLSAWCFGGDNFGSAMSHQFSGAVVIELGTAPAEAGR